MKRLYYRILAIALATVAMLPIKAQQVEYFWDSDPGVGNGLVLQTFTGNTATVQAQLDVSGLSEGIHQLGIRALNGDHYSATYYRSFYVPATPHSVEAIEYFFDDDPGVGNAIRKPATITDEMLTMAFDVDTEGLSEGVHHIGIRTLTDGTWSATKVRQFLVRSAVDNYITYMEYFWDEDPGAGNGFVVDVTPGQEVTFDFEADMSELAEGTHTLGLRAQSGSGGWSTTSFVRDIEFEGWDALQEYLTSLTDSEDEVTADTYKRQFRNKNWHALYVPFALSYNDWSAHFDVARINAFYQYDDDEDGVVDRQVLEAIMVRPGNGSLKPNYPYLIRAKVTGNYTISVSPSKTEPQQVNSVSCSTLEARYTFTGNYADMTGLKSASRYRLRGGSLSIPESDDEVLPPYRWYLTVDDLGNQLEPSAARIQIQVIGDDTNVIDDTLFSDEEPIGSHKVYDLSGRRVDVSPSATLRSLPKGVYLINNKKCVVK